VPETNRRASIRADGRPTITKPSRAQNRLIACRNCEIVRTWRTAKDPRPPDLRLRTARFDSGLEAILAVVLDTSASAPHRRLAIWQDIVCDIFVGLDCRSDLHDAFWGAVAQSRVGPAAFTRVDSCAQNVLRTPARIARTAAVLQRLYRELEQPWYDHDFGNISYDEPAYDAQLGMPGMHKVKRKVEHQSRESCIPPELFAKYADLNFWLKPEISRREIVVL
jgi:hypothetical protein